MLKLPITCCSLLVFGLALLSAPARGQEPKTAGATLEVKVNYTGTGTVDGKHKIYVVLWDTPEFINGGGTMPVQVVPVVAKDGTAVFTGVAKSPAYISVAFDPTGQWDAQSGPPPTGSSLGLYSKTAGKPEPINAESGKKTGIEVTFDDSMKMP